MNLIKEFSFFGFIPFLVILSYHQKANAGAWVIIQESTIGTTGIEQNQIGSSMNAIQTINNIKLPSGDTLSAGSSQTVNVNSKPVTFIQDGTTSNSVQALNRITADSISSNVTQTVSNLGTVSFSQPSTGSGNTQALNAIAVTGSASNITQSITKGGSTATLTFDQSSGTGNLQAGNLIEADTVGVISQSVNVDVINFLGNNPDLQAANVVIYNSGAIDDVTQSVSASTVNASGGLRADHIAPQTLNYIGVRP